MNEKFTAGLKKATNDMFQTMLGLTIKMEDMDDMEKDARFDVSSIVGLAGGHIGSISIHMNEAEAKALTGAMLGMDVESIDDDIKDAIGEIGNIIVGSTKTILSSENLTFNISLPTVVIGPQHSTSRLNIGGDVGALHITFDGGDLYIEYCVKKIG